MLHLSQVLLPSSPIPVGGFSLSAEIVGGRSLSQGLWTRALALYCTFLNCLIPWGLQELKACKKQPDCFFSSSPPSLITSAVFPTYSVLSHQHLEAIIAFNNVWNRLLLQTCYTGSNLEGGASFPSFAIQTANWMLRVPSQKPGQCPASHHHILFIFCPSYFFPYRLWSALSPHTCGFHN